MTAPGVHQLFSHYLHYYLSPSGPVVQLQKYDLLPGAKQEPPLGEGHCQAWPYQGGANVGMAVSVLPAQVMGVFNLLGHEPV